MSEVKRYINCVIGMTGVEMVRATDYAKLSAEAQALREEVAQQKFLTKVENDALKMMTDKANELKSEVEQLEEELESLRARAVVVPERELFTQYLPGAIPRNADEVSAWKEGWNACLDELARLNGLTVSEGLLRRLCEPLLSHADYVVARNELRALLNQDKENGNG